MSVKLRKRKLANGGLSYYLDITQDGKRWTETLHKVSKSETAELRKEKKILAETRRNNRDLQLQSIGSTYQPKFLQKVEIAEYCEIFVREYKKADHQVLLAAIQKLKVFFKTKNIKFNISFKYLTEELIIEFCEYLKYDAGLTGSTPLNYFKKIKMILKKAKREKLIELGFMSDYRFRTVANIENSVKKNVLNEREIDKLWITDCQNNEVKKAFLYACYTGLGLAEIVDLKWKDIIDDVVNVRRKKTKTRITNLVSPRMMQALGERKNNNDYVFNLRNKYTGNPLTTNGVNAALKKWMDAAQLPRHYTFYCGRHTFATRLLLNDVDLKTVGDAMGHTSTTVTGKYLNHVSELKDRATSQLS